MRMYIVAIALVMLPQVVSAAPSSSELVASINIERQKAGVGLLVVNDKLNKAAEKKAAELASLGFLIHTSAPKNTPWQVIADEGYIYKLVGENLAVGFSSAQDVSSNWMRSPSHRANVLHSGYKEVGTATVEGIFAGEKESFTVMYFAIPKAPEIKPVEILATTKNAQLKHSEEEKRLLELIAVLQNLIKQILASRA